MKCIYIKERECLGKDTDFGKMCVAIQLLQATIPAHYNEEWSSDEFRMVKCRNYEYAKKRGVEERIIMATASKEEKKFKDIAHGKLFYMMAEILEREGINHVFLQDSNDIKFALETIKNRMWFWMKNAEKNKQLIEQYRGI